MATTNDRKPDGDTRSDADGKSDPGTALPHERDQSTAGDATGGMGTGAAGEQQKAVMGQAHADLKSGQVDTDLRATPGQDAERRDRLVKESANAKPESTAHPHDSVSRKR